MPALQIKKKLNCILLIDDDEPINFLHKMVIEKSDCAEKVEVKMNGIQALEYLRSEVNGQHPQPDLIFLDINMPAMNGWEFLDEYKKLSENMLAKLVVVMLTTSLNPDDHEKARAFGEIRGFHNKPLNVESLNKILLENFPHHF